MHSGSVAFMNDLKSFGQPSSVLFDAGWCKRLRNFANIFSPPLHAVNHNIFRSFVANVGGLNLIEEQRQVCGQRVLIIVEQIGLRVLKNLHK